MSESKRTHAELTAFAALVLMGLFLPQVMAHTIYTMFIGTENSSALLDGVDYSPNIRPQTTVENEGCTEQCHLDRVKESR